MRPHTYQDYETHRPLRQMPRRENRRRETVLHPNRPPLF